MLKLLLLSFAWLGNSGMCVLVGGGRAVNRKHHPAERCDLRFGFQSAQPFYLLSFSALFSGRVVSSNILAMLPMTSSQVHLWSIGLWMLIGVLIISPTAGGGGLGRLRCNVDSEGGKYTSASPRCTCLPPRQHCAEVALGAFTTDSSAMLTRREASTPRLRLGVLASLLVNIALKLHSEESKYTSATPRCTCFPPRGTSTRPSSSTPRCT